MIARSEMRATVQGSALSVICALALATAAWALLPDADTIQNGGVLVALDPLGRSFRPAVLLLAFMLAIAGIVSVAHDRDSGALEVLFFGPVDEPSYVIGKMAGLVAAYLVATPTLLIGSAILGLLTGFEFTIAVVLVVVASAVPVGLLVCVGALFAIGARRLRTALSLFVVYLGSVLGLSVAYRAVVRIPIEDPNSSVLVVRDVLESVTAITDWMSPMTYVDRVSGSLLAGDAVRSMIDLALASILLTAVSIAAIALLRARGVHGREE